LSGLKKTEEKRQAAVQGDAQVTEILAEAAKLQQSMLTGIDQILDKYKVKRKDSGEKVFGVSLKSTDLEDMKLPPPAQEEINRLMAATSQSLSVLQIKLQGQKYMAEHLATIDGVTKELSEATDALGKAYQNRASTELATLANTMKTLEKARLDQWQAREDHNRQDSAAHAQQVWDTFNDANQRYFKYMLTNKPMSAGALVENLVKSYFTLVKTFTGGRSLGDVMGPRYDKAKSSFQEERNLYDSF
jgi:hypothetical protein